MDIDQLIRDDEVHRDVYVSEEVFALEMDRIFGSAWIYVGHDSQIPEPGDYWTTRVGLESVVMARGKQDEINVFYNRCPHKGARIAGDGCGHTKGLFRCPYHAWTFNLDGTLRGVPYLEGYQNTRFDMADPRFSLRKVAQVASYRGFVFASLSEKAVDFESFIAGIKSSLDNFCDRAPNGTVSVAGGVFRVVQRSNWKIFFENLNDTGHPIATHESSFRAARQYADEELGGELPFELHIIDGNGAPPKFWSDLDLHAFDFGHSYMTAIFNAPDDPLSQSYFASLAAKVGEDRAKEILGVNRHNTIIYPSCSPHTSFQQWRVIRPLSVDRTLVEIFTFRLDGAPEELLQRTFTYSNVVNSPSSIVMTDDVHVYAECQKGLATQGGDWVSQHRNAGQDLPFSGADGGEIGVGTSELPIRNQFRAWREYMAGDVSETIPLQGSER